jgi:hypothetical protein
VKADHSPPSSAEVENGGTVPSLPLTSSWCKGKPIPVTGPEVPFLLKSADKLYPQIRPCDHHVIYVYRHRVHALKKG